MNRNLAYFLSGAFHPLLIPTILIGIIYAFFPGAAIQLAYRGKISLLVIIFLTTFVMPALSITLLRSLNLITSVTLFDQKERTFPFLIITLTYAVLAYVFAYENMINKLFSAVFIGMAVLALLITILNRWIKISVHSASMSGMVGFVIGLEAFFPMMEHFKYLLSGVIILTGAVSSSRLSLNSHKPVEVLLGAILGLVVSIGTVVVVVN